MVARFQKLVYSARQNLFVKQSLLTLLLRVFGAIILFGFTVFLTKTYPAERVGQYDFVRSFLLVSGSITLLGFEGAILYFRGRTTLTGIRQIYFKMVGMLLVTSSVIVLLFLCMEKGFVNDYFADAELYDLLLKAVLCLFCYGLSTLNTEVFRAMDHIVIAELFRNILKYVPLVLGAVLLWYYGLQSYLVEVFLFSFVLIALGSTLLLFYYFATVKQDTQSLNISYKEILVKSYPLALSGLAMFLLLSIDIFLLKKYYNNATVAFYSVAVKLMTLLTLVILSVNINVSAKISQSYFSGNSEELIKIVRHCSRLIVLISLPLILLLCSAPLHILEVFGKEYMVAKQPLLILVLGQGICSGFGASSVYLNMTGRQHLFLVIMLLAVVLNALLNSLLIPRYGMNGAAISFSAATFFWNSSSALLIYKMDKIKVFLT